MNITVAVRCYNEEKNIDRFVRGYSFADKIIISDGGSTDHSLEILKALESDKVEVIHFDQKETVHGETWNPDAPHMNFVLNHAKAQDPDWLIFDDMDCVPNLLLQDTARFILGNCKLPQVNVFRLYMWGTKEYFPYMNRYFDYAYTSLWAWRPTELDIYADEAVRHGTLVGVSENPYTIDIPNCLLHKSWQPETVQRKIDRYNHLGLPMTHPLEFAGTPEILPAWATE